MVDLRAQDFTDAEPPPPEEPAVTATLLRFGGDSEPSRKPEPTASSVFAVASDSESLGLELGEILGRGGMGLVRRARQLALDREVAVKTVRPDRVTPEARNEILREALIAGSLEHPNIIPIYELHWSSSGEPLIVMKKVAGTRWSVMMHNPAARPAHTGSELHFNLDVLLKVCNAVAFAHSRGVIHRDIKPDNVMVGSFGEVYLLDWGLAASISDDGSGRIPLLQPTEFLSGTPGYLAPEMVQGLGAQLSPQTDIYLLGATLHKIVTGEVRHPGPFHEAMQSALCSTPFAYGAQVPEELAEICNRAMHADRAQRYPSVAAFRSAVELFLSHESSLAFSREAEEKLEAAKAEVRAAGGKPLGGLGYAIAPAVFAFEHALRVHPGNEAARRGLDEAISLVVQNAIARRDFRAAERWLERQSRRSPELEQSLQAARTEATTAVDRGVIDTPRPTADSDGPPVSSDPRLRRAGLVWPVAPILTAVAAEVAGASLERWSVLVEPSLAWLGLALLHRRAIAAPGRGAGLNQAWGLTVLCVALLTLLRAEAFRRGFSWEVVRSLDFVPIVAGLGMLSVLGRPRAPMALALASVGLALSLNLSTLWVAVVYAVTHWMTLRYLFGPEAKASGWAAAGPEVRP